MRFPVTNQKVKVVGAISLRKLRRIGSRLRLGGFSSSLRLNCNREPCDEYEQ
jgi:hypothetical protein